MFSLRFHLILALVALTLVACGSSDNSTTSQNSDDGSVQLYGAKVATSASNLPTCDSTQVGQLFYVLADEEFQFCSSEGYQSIDLRGSTGANGADGENGTNGTNGTNGADGEDGADGSSCSVIENANGSKTILCEDGTTATVNDGASCTVADNGNGSYDLTCSGTTVTVRDGRDGISESSSSAVSSSSSAMSSSSVASSSSSVASSSAVSSSSSAMSSSSVASSSSSVASSSAVSSSSSAMSSSSVASSSSSSIGAWCNTTGNCGTFTDTRETPAKVYKWTKIGTQTWMAENLAYLPSVNDATDNSTTVAKYYVYNYDGTVVADAKASSYYTTYGVLYNWTAAMGVCPTGWHLPSSAEWATLEATVGGFGTAGTKLKSVSGWTSGITGTDAYGFSALPSGYYYGSDFNYALYFGYWWSATENDATYAYDRYMIYDGANVNSNNRNKYYGFSVRCLQD